MAKFPTRPTLFDEVLQISISKLKEWKYLKPNQIMSGVINWNRNGNKMGSISIVVNTGDAPFVELTYSYNKEPINYKIALVSLPSNLNNGKVWYFLCPKTGKRCRVLYQVGGYFLHREAFNGCMYESQTKSKSGRVSDRLIKNYFGSGAPYEQLKKKYFKRTYAGKSTKRYIKLMKEINRLNNIDPEVVTKLIVYGKL